MAKITMATHRKLVLLAKKVYPEYTGRKFNVKYETTVDTSYNANWCGGSKTYYKFVRLDTNQVMSLPDIAPWNRNPEKETATIPAMCACVTHNFFCGTDCGLTIILPKENQINT